MKSIENGCGIVLLNKCCPQFPCGFISLLLRGHTSQLWWKVPSSSKVFCAEVVIFIYIMRSWGWFWKARRVPISCSCRWIYMCSGRRWHGCYSCSCCCPCNWTNSDIQSLRAIGERNLCTTAKFNLHSTNWKYRGNSSHSIKNLDLYKRKMSNVPYESDDCCSQSTMIAKPTLSFNLCVYNRWKEFTYVCTAQIQPPYNNLKVHQATAIPASKTLNLYKQKMETPQSEISLKNVMVAVLSKVCLTKTYLIHTCNLWYAAQHFKILSSMKVICKSWALFEYKREQKKGKLHVEFPMYTHN